MTAGDTTVERPLNTAGREARHRRRITERQQTAQRLLMAAAEEVYDGDLDVNWDAPIEDGAPWMPEWLSTIHNSELWSRLSASDRDELLRREFVSFLSFGVYAESAMTLIHFRDVAENEDLVDEFTRYSLKSIQEETRNSFMFTRLINVTGLDVYRLTPAGARALSTFAPMVPAGALSAGLVLMVQEAIHSFVHEIAGAEGVQPHARQVMRIHEIAGRRHIEFSRTEFAAEIERLGRVRRLVVGHLLARAATRLYPMFLDERVYADVGLPAKEAMRTALTGPAGRRTARAMTESFVQYAFECGLFRTHAERRILQDAGIYARPHR